MFRPPPAARPIPPTFVVHDALRMGSETVLKKPMMARRDRPRQSPSTQAMGVLHIKCLLNCPSAARDPYLFIHADYVLVRAAASEQFP